MKTLPSHILIATRNRGKVHEIQEMVRELSVRFMSLDDVEQPPDVVEDGATFEENAVKKARTMAKIFGIPTLADDSGLCVDALDGRPGVLSARYGGEGTSDEEKCLRILGELADVPDPSRTARFVCVLALAEPGGEVMLFSGSCEGHITRELRGNHGFGYDPIFFSEELAATFAERTMEEKNRVSHRGKALREFSLFLSLVAGEPQKS